MKLAQYNRHLVIIIDAVGLELQHQVISIHNADQELSASPRVSSW